MNNTLSLNFFTLKFLSVLNYLISINKLFLEMEELFLDFINRTNSYFFRLM